MEEFLLKISVFLVVLIIFSGTVISGNQDNPAEDSSAPSNAVTENVVTTSAIEEPTTESNVLTPDSNGVIPLKNYTNSYALSSAMHQPNVDETRRYLIWCKADATVKTVSKTAPLAIYDAYNKITFIKLNDNPLYFVPLNFDDITDKADSFPNKMEGFDDDLYELTDPGYPIEECNNVVLDEFIKAHSVAYKQAPGLGSAYSEYLFLCGEKNEEFEFGGYKGTKWITATVTASYALYTPSTDNKVEIVTTPTKNGYFSVDVSSLEAGVYYIREYDTLLEFV